MLEAALRDDAQLRRDFIEYMNLDSALSDLAALSEAEVAEIEKSTVFSADESASIEGTSVRRPQHIVLSPSWERLR